MFFCKVLRKYCIDCEKFYSTSIKHSQNCPTRCNHCGQMGCDFPCKKEENVEETCVECNRTFYNKKCFKLHRLGGLFMGLPMCKVRHKCINCGKEYTVKKWKEHKCIKRIVKK